MVVTEPTIEIASRKVRMSPELMAQFASRTVDGYRVVWDWGEPDADGFYEPSVTTDYTDRLADHIDAIDVERLARVLRAWAGPLGATGVLPPIHWPTAAVAIARAYEEATDGR